MDEPTVLSPEWISSSWRRRKEDAKERMKICSTCDKFDSKTTQCKECGCFMLMKTLLPGSECPLNKWKTVIDPFSKDETENT